MDKTTRKVDEEEQRAGKFVLLPGEKAAPSTEMSDLKLYHMTNWLDCMRSGKQPAAPVHAGFAHSVACIMSDLAYRQGKKMYWDAKNELIVETPPETQA